MSFHEKNSQLTFNWILHTEVAPLVKADFDILLTLPDGTTTYTDDGITTYTAPTATAQGKVTFNYTPTVVGLHIVTLTVGGSTDFVVQACRRVFIVDAPPEIASPPITTTSGPIIPPADPGPPDDSWGILAEDYDIIGTEFDAIVGGPASTTLSVLDENICVDASGTRLYIAANNGIYQYALASAWNINPLPTYVGFLDISTAEVWEISGMSADGTKMLLFDNDAFTVLTMSTGFDITTGSIGTKYFNSGDSITFAHEVSLNPDGSDFWVYSHNYLNGRAVRYTMSPAWDPSTITETATEFDFSAIVTVADMWEGNDYNPNADIYGVCWTDNGTYLQIGLWFGSPGNSPEVLFTYECSTPYDPNSGTLMSTTPSVLNGTPGDKLGGIQISAHHGTILAYFPGSSTDLELSQLSEV